MRKAFSLLIVVLALTLPNSGCAGAEGSPGVEKTIWILDSFADESVEVNSYGDVMPHATLADGEVSGNLGVNSFSGTYELSGSDISFTQLTSTEKAGPSEAMEQESRFLAALDAATHVEVQDRGLLVADSTGTMLMRLTEALEG